MRLKIRRLDPTVPLPTYGTDEAAGFDLAAAHWDGPRSGPSSQHWLVGSRRDPTSGVGVIDPDYSGPNDEVMVQVLNFTSTEVQITRGDRIAQAIVLPAPRVSWQEVTEIREATRGGFGVTGN